MKPKISVVISAFNEQDLIEDCLKSVKDLADEIIFVDNTSSDRTVKIAQKYTGKIYRRPNNPVNLNINKNFGFEKAAGDWIISLDADECLTPELIREIRSTVNRQPLASLRACVDASRERSGSTVNGYEIPRKNIIFGKWIAHSIWWPDYNLRLFRRGKGKFAAKHVHEKLEVNGEVGKLENPMVHYNYKTVSQFINKLNKTYTESETENFLKAGKSINWYDAIRWPTADFVKTFFFEKGYKDGLHGLVLSLFQAFYALVFFAKVWERKENFRDLFEDDTVIAIPSEAREKQSMFLNAVIREFQKASRDIRYWIYETLMAENPAKKLYFRLRRKLR